MSGVLINGNRLGRLHRDILAYLIKWGFWRLFFFVWFIKPLRHHGILTTHHK